MHANTWQLPLSLKNTTKSLTRFFRERSRYLHVSRNIVEMAARRDEAGVEHSAFLAVEPGRGNTFNRGKNAAKRMKPTMHHLHTLTRAQQHRNDMLDFAS